MLHRLWLLGRVVGKSHAAFTARNWNREYIVVFASFAGITLHRLHPRDADRTLDTTYMTARTTASTVFVVLHFMVAMINIFIALPRVVADHLGGWFWLLSFN